MNKSEKSASLSLSPSPPIFFFFFYRHETITIDQNREFFRINTTDKTILFANRSGIRHFPSNERANIRKNIRSDNDRITFFNMYD